MDASTITLLAGIISCLIGICTFVVGMNSRAQKTGILEQKVDQAVSGIEEIKSELKSTSKAHNALALQTTSQEERITTLFTRLDNLEKEQGYLSSRLASQNQLEEALVRTLERLGKEVS